MFPLIKKGSHNSLIDPEISSLFSVFDDIRREVLNNFQDSSSFFPKIKDKAKFPKIEMRIDEKDKTMLIDFFVAGYGAGDILVEFDEKTSLLTVRANKTEERTEDGIFYSEVRKSQFCRSLKINPEEIDKTRSFESNMKDGVLRISVPIILENKEEEKTIKRIEIKSD